MAFGALAEGIGGRVEPKAARGEIYVGLAPIDPQCLHIRRAYQRKLAGICAALAQDCSWPLRGRVGFSPAVDHPNLAISTLSGLRHRLEFTDK